MPVKVLIPGPLRKSTNGEAEVPAEGGTVAEVIHSLIGAHPGLGGMLTDRDGKVRPFIRLYLNGSDTTKLNGDDTPVRDGDVLDIIPAAAGG